MAELAPQAAEGLHHLEADTMSERYNIRAGFSLQDAVLGNSDPSAVLYGLAADYMRADLPEWVHMETLAAQVADLTLLADQLCEEHQGKSDCPGCDLAAEHEYIQSAASHVGAVPENSAGLLDQCIDLGELIRICKDGPDKSSNVGDWIEEIKDLRTDRDFRVTDLEKEIEDLRETVQALEAELLGAGE